MTRLVSSIVGLAVAAVVGAVVIAIMGHSVIAAYGTFVTSSIGSLSGIAQTLNKISPLLLMGLAVAVALRGGFFNIGADGQLYGGAILATGIAFALGDTGLPALALIPVLLAAGIAGGALTSALPGWLRVRWSVNEIFVTVMLNFVLIYLTEYLTTGPWTDQTTGEAVSMPLPAQAELPMLSQRLGTHSGVLVALLTAAGVWWVLERTLFGFEVRAIGDNPKAAELAGIAIGRVTKATFLLSGALAGLAGAIEVLGLHQRLILGITPGYGAMAILIAVLGRAQVGGVFAASIGISILLVGSDSLQRSIGLPASAALVFFAVIVLTVLLLESRRRRASSAVPP
jgi:simple sugar transport system permease protein